MNNENTTTQNPCLDKVYTYKQLMADDECDNLVGVDLVVFDLANPDLEFVLYGFDEIGDFEQGMKMPRYKFTKA